MTTSSANVANITLLDLDISAIYIEKEREKEYNIGPSTDPCGTLIQIKRKK